MASGARVLAMCVTDTWASPTLLTRTEGGDVTASGPLAERGGRDGGSRQGHSDEQRRPTRWHEQWNGPSSQELVTPVTLVLDTRHGVPDDVQGPKPQPLVGLPAVVGAPGDGGGSPERIWQRCVMGVGV
jgi:hypothetical protein